MFSYYTYQPKKDEESKLYAFLAALDMRARISIQEPKSPKKKHNHKTHGSINKLKKDENNMH